MRSRLLLLLLSVVSMTAFAQPPAGKANAGDSYGKKISPDGAASPALLMQVFAKADTIPFKVKAHVIDVCSNKGCWMTFKVNDSTEAFVKMKDYGFFVPLALKGKQAVIEGRAFAKTTTVEELKHYASDAGQTQAQIDAISKPKKEIRVIATGIAVAP